MLVAKVDNALRLSAVDRKATALGLAIGQPLANARAMLPELKAVAANDSADLKLLTRIADWCDRFTPFVALDGPRHLLLDVTGVAHLFGSEQALLDRIRDSLQRQGFALRGALAGTAVAARALAHYRDGVVVSSNEEEQVVKPLPVAALNLAAATTHALRRAGLKTIGQVAARKRAELTARFGSAMVDVLDEAFGLSAKPITPRKPPPDYCQEQNFAEPVMTEEVIRATLRSLTVALAKILERQGQGARRLEALFFRADGATRCIAIELSMPTREAAVVDRLVREKLATLSDGLDPGFGFDLIRLCASRIESMEAGAMALDGAARDESEISFLVDRLATRFGSTRILVFRPQDTHVPEKAFVAVPAQQATPSKSAWRKIRCAHDAPRRPLRLFASPEVVDFKGGQHFLWRKVQHVVRHCEGPERLAMEWWRHETPKPARDYFRVEDSEGKRYWLYRNDATSQWFLHGIFA